MAVKAESYNEAFGGVMEFIMVTGVTRRLHHWCHRIQPDGKTVKCR